MNLNKCLIIAFIICQLGASCNVNKKVIVFHCLHCKGCVSIAFNEIISNRIDSTYKIILDTACFKTFSLMSKFNYEQLPQADIEKKFGEFANIRIYDSTGKMTNLKTDMNLMDYIK